jgi:acyl-lipid omega-6 desaturase (Delta-12 desaturase)
MTVQEYLEASRGKRIAYRLARNPAIMFVLGPLYVFLIQHRIPMPRASRQSRASVHWTNLAIAAMAGAMGWAIGFTAYAVLQVAVVMVAGTAGLWLFYVQHQFEGVYWQRSDQWDPIEAALRGSSFYKLPRVLQWFTGSIGFHHLHHLDPRIPNYNLEKCHLADPLFQSVPPVTLLSSLKSITFRLWDEQRRRLVGFGHLRTLRRASPSPAP